MFYILSWDLEIDIETKKNCKCILNLKYTARYFEIIFVDKHTRGMKLSGTMLVSV